MGLAWGFGALCEGTMGLTVEERGQEKRLNSYCEELIQSYDGSTAINLKLIRMLRTWGMKKVGFQYPLWNWSNVPAS